MANKSKEARFTQRPLVQTHVFRNNNPKCEICGQPRYSILMQRCLKKRKK